MALRISIWNYMVYLKPLFCLAVAALIVVSLKSLSSVLLPCASIVLPLSASSPKMTILSRIRNRKKLVSARHGAGLNFITLKRFKGARADSTRFFFNVTVTPAVLKVTILRTSLGRRESRFGNIKVFAAVSARLYSSIFRSVSGQSFGAFSPQIHAVLLAPFHSVFQEYFDIAQKRIEAAV